MAEIDVKIKVTGDQARSKLQDFSKAVSEADNNVIGLQGSIRGINSAFSSFVGNLAAAGVSRVFNEITTGVSDFVKSSVRSAAEIEVLRSRFETLTGSIQDANTVLQNVQDLADNSPFDDLKVADAARELLLFGTSVQDVEKELKVLGDVSVASGVDLAQLTTIFGRIRDQGLLASDTLKQLVKNGIPIGEVLAQNLGVSEQAIKKLASQGKISADQFEEAFQTLNKAGGFAFEAIEKRGQTLEGRLKKLNDTVDNLKEDVGAQLSPVLKTLTTVFTDLIERVRVSGELKEFVDYMASLIPQAISFTFDALGFLIDAFFATKKAINFVFAGLASIETVAIDAAIAFLQAGQFIDKFLNKFTDRSAAIQGTETLINNLKTLKEVASDQAAESLASNDRLGQSQQKYADLVAKAKEFVINAYKKELAAAKESEEAQDKQESKATARVQALSEADQKLLEEREKTLEQILILEEANNLLRSEADFLFQEQRLLQFQEFFTLEEQAVINAQLKLQEGTLAYENTILNIKKQGLERQNKAEDENRKKRQQLDEKAKQDQLRLEQATLQAKGNLLQSFFNFAGTVAKEGSKEQFLIQKAAAVAGIIVSTQQAMAAARLVPPAPNEFLVGLTKAAGALNLATVAAQTIKGYEDGGVVGGNSYSGDRVMARVNSGEMILNRQQQSNLFNQINGQGGQSNQPMVIHTTVNVDGETVARAVSKQVANGFKLGEVQ